MSEQVTPTAGGTSDGLLRWLLGGLVAGGIVLGLLVAAYAIGYHRGRHHARSTIPSVPPPAATTTTSTAAPALGPVAVTPALVARGKTLYTADGCTACHSLTGAAGVGPTLKGIAGRPVTLANGQTVTADDSYLEESIISPEAQIVKGYRAVVMPAAIAGHDLGSKPDDIRALVAFIKSQK